MRVRKQSHYSRRAAVPDVNPQATTAEQSKKKGVRQILSGVDEVRAAVVEVTGLANRSLSILTHNLEPEIYDHDDFLDTLKRFILQRTFARVRVLIVDPTRAIKTSSRFVNMGRRLNSYIEFRNVKPEFRGEHPEAYCIADEQALVYRARATSWDGMSDTHAPAIARHYLTTFEAIWQACEIEPELRQLQL